MHDLTKVIKFINEKNPSAIFVVDTNILFSEPDVASWKTDVSEPLFILSADRRLELEFIKNKPRSMEGATKAIRSLHQLFREGLPEGIWKKEIGCFITVPSLRTKERKSALDEWEQEVKVLGPMDVMQLILTHELSLGITKIPTILMTKDNGLFDFARGNGIRSFLFEGFPISGLQKVVQTLIKEPQIKPIDWDIIREDIQRSMVKKSVEVELTLTDKRNTPVWLNDILGIQGQSQVIIAEGHGVILHPTLGKVMFRWELPFSPWGQDFLPGNLTSKNLINALQPQQIPVTSQTRYLDKTQLDFLGADVKPLREIADELSERISSFAEVDLTANRPILQESISVLGQTLLLYYLDEQHTEITEDIINVFKDKIRSYDNLINFLDEWFYSEYPDASVFLPAAIFGALGRCWPIGGKVRIRLPFQGAN